MSVGSTLTSCANSVPPLALTSSKLCPPGWRHCPEDGDEVVPHRATFGNFPVCVRRPSTQAQGKGNLRPSRHRLQGTVGFVKRTQDEADGF